MVMFVVKHSLAFACDDTQKLHLIRTDFYFLSPWPQALGASHNFDQWNWPQFVGTAFQPYAVPCMLLMCYIIYQHAGGDNDSYGNQSLIHYASCSDQITPPICQYEDLGVLKYFNISNESNLK